MTFRYLSCLLFAAGLLGLSCASGPKVQRTEASETIDLSGDWNDTDSRLVAEEMVRDSLNRPWLEDFVSAKSAKPRVIVGTVKNRSSEHINTQTFVKDLEKELLNSGKVRFQASREERQEIREERMEQQTHASLETQKSMGKEKAADYMLQGGINTIMDQAGGTQLKYYQVELELVDIESNEKVWIGQKKIKKVVERKGHKL
ncbi:MAG: penicillin-binding protein activator LpoB [Nitrospirae bacterium]|nr:penicillin-binding protein activator LpoB [Nitrospirota bacterium]